MELFQQWTMFGFGDAKADQGGYGGQTATVNYSASDIRFTRSKDNKTLYMIFLGKPESGWTKAFRLLADHRYFPEGEVKKVSFLKSGQQLDYELNGYGFKVNLPDSNQLNAIANVVKIELK